MQIELTADLEGELRHAAAMQSTTAEKLAVEILTPVLQGYKWQRVQRAAVESMVKVLKESGLKERHRNELVEQLMLEASNRNRAVRTHLMCMIMQVEP